MIVVAIADDESRVGNLEVDKVDVLISCGDLYDSAISRAIDTYQPDACLAVRGNHDPNSPFHDSVTDLHLSTLEFGGIRFGGFKGSWQYKPRGHHLFEQPEVTALMQRFPAVDVLVTHNSPAGIHERDKEVHQGFEGFLQYLDRTKPKLMIHGHQHIEQESRYGATRILSVFGEAFIEL